MENMITNGDIRDGFHVKLTTTEFSFSLSLSLSLSLSFPTVNSNTMGLEISGHNAACDNNKQNPIKALLVL